jgi:formate dehydrogenase iron-sulfur subunit
MSSAQHRIYIPCDSAAVSVGANTIATKIAQEARARGLDVEIIRNGSRGLLWLEPLVEVETPKGRIAYGPVKPRDVSSLFDAGFQTGGQHALRLGDIEQHPSFAAQTRLTFARVGIIDPISISDYKTHGGFKGLEKALTLKPEDIINHVAQSGLRGRGGAGFPTGIKWQTVHKAQADQKYIVCNADEGDSGTFADRMMMEGDPFTLIEGMIIAGLATGATRGYIYIRSEYPDAMHTITSAIEQAQEQNYLGSNILGTGHHFRLEARLGAGAYICGEETSLLESLEGKRGIVRAKPPLPALEGLFGKPTVVNNVLTLCAIPYILAQGGEAYARLGVNKSRGTLPVQLAGNIRYGGLYELPFGMSLRDIIVKIGGGTRSGRPIRAVQVGGPLGAYLPDHLLDTALDYEALSVNKGLLGHGGIVVFDDSVNMAKQARFAFEFCAKESCGKCTPCRIGAVRGVEVMDHIIAHKEVEKNTTLLKDLCEVMTDGSLCAMGGLTPMPVMSALTHFPADFDQTPKRKAAE